jgi:type I restriction enzyme S subunit
MKLFTVGRYRILQHLYQNVFKDFSFPVPLIPEQRAISLYLDDRTRKIDSLIDKKQKLIELLKEERAAVINQAVTKGLNHDVPMKDSGIEWLGEIPKHWQIKKMKNVADVKSSNVDKKSYDNEIKVLLCNYIDVYNNEFIDNSFSFMEATANENEIAKFNVKKGDVLVTKDSETPDDIANPAYIKKDLINTICGYHLAQIRANQIELIGGVGRSAKIHFIYEEDYL